MTKTGMPRSGAYERRKERVRSCETWFRLRSPSPFALALPDQSTTPKLSFSGEKAGPPDLPSKFRHSIIRPHATKDRNLSFCTYGLRGCLHSDHEAMRFPKPFRAISRRIRDHSLLLRKPDKILSLMPLLDLGFHSHVTALSCAQGLGRNVFQGTGGHQITIEDQWNSTKLLACTTVHRLR